jgi:hypothetical protein
VDGLVARIQHLEERNGFTWLGRRGNFAGRDRIAGLSLAFITIHGLTAAHQVAHGESKSGIETLKHW